MPAAPTATDDIIVTAEVDLSDGLPADVVLNYRVMYEDETALVETFVKVDFCTVQIQVALSVYGDADSMDIPNGVLDFVDFIQYNNHRFIENFELLQDIDDQLQGDAALVPALRQLPVGRRQQQGRATKPDEGSLDGVEVLALHARLLVV